MSNADKPRPVEGIVGRLREAATGHPHAAIPWPHRILHEAADEIERLQKELEERKKIRSWPPKYDVTDGDYAELDRCQVRRQSPRGQAGYSRWGMLSVMLLLVILGMAPRQGVAVVFEDNYLTGTLVTAPKDILVFDSRKENISNVFTTSFWKFGMSVGNTFLSWRDGLINDFWFAQKRYLRVLGKPFRVINEFANRDIFYEFISPAHSPLNLGYVRGGFPEIIDSQSPRLLVVSGFLKSSTSTISSLDRHFLRFAEWSTTNDISTFGTFGGLVSALHSEVANNEETSGKKYEGKISRLSFAAQDFLVITFGILICALGLFLLRYGGFIEGFGIFLVIFGITIGIYGPDIWGLWWAQ